MKSFKKYWLWLLYVVLLAGYAVYITFFDENNLINRRKNYEQIKLLETQKQNCLDKIEADKATILSLKDTNNNAFLEKFARERYYFKKADEDIVIVKYEK